MILSKSLMMTMKNIRHRLLNPRKKPVKNEKYKIAIATGDTKVMEKGKIDKIIIKK